VHITKFEFLNLAHSKQVQLFISIRVCDKLQLSPTSVFIGSKKNIQQFILKIKTFLNSKGLLIPLEISSMSSIMWNASFILMGWNKFLKRNLLKHYGCWL
jgi:hypothetical protein